MIPKINARGHSFKGVAEYLMHDKQDEHDPTAQTSERVGMSESFNLGGADIELAARLMAYTDIHRDELKENSTGAKASAGAVYHYSVAWAEDEAPDTDHMRETALSSIKHLGLDAHQFFIVQHTDTKHAHMHIVVNLTNQETGKRAELGLDQRKLSAWAGAYEKEHGLKCEARQLNEQTAEATGKRVKHQQQKRDYSAAVTRAFERSDTGQTFINALKSVGLELGRSQRGKGFVLVDDRGSIQALTRNLDVKMKWGRKSAAIAEKLADVAADQIKDGDKIAAAIREKNKQIWIEERKAERKAERDKIRQADIAAELKTVQERQKSVVLEVEKQLSETVGARLKIIKFDAENLQTTIEERGFKGSMRRLWRGRKDRENLAQMKDEIAQAKAVMEKTRDDLRQIHARELLDLKKQHEKERLNFKDQTPARQIETLEAMLKDKRLGIKRGWKGQKLRPKRTKHARNMHVSLEQAQRERRERIQRQIYQLKEQETAKETAAYSDLSHRAEKADAQARHKERQAEIADYDTEGGKSRVERQIEASKSKRDKGKGFER